MPKHRQQPGTQGGLFAPTQYETGLRAVIAHLARTYRYELRPALMDSYVAALGGLPRDVVDRVLEPAGPVITAYPDAFPFAGQLRAMVLARMGRVTPTRATAPSTEGPAPLEDGNRWEKLAQCWEDCPPTKARTKEQWMRERAARESLQLPTGDPQELVGAILER